MAADVSVQFMCNYCCAGQHAECSTQQLVFCRCNQAGHDTAPAPVNDEDPAKVDAEMRLF